MANSRQSVNALLSRLGLDDSDRARDSRQVPSDSRDRVIMTWDQVSVVDARQKPRRVPAHG